MNMRLCAGACPIARLEALSHFGSARLKLLPDIIATDALFGKLVISETLKVCRQMFMEAVSEPRQNGPDRALANIKTFWIIGLRCELPRQVWRPGEYIRQHNTMASLFTPAMRPLGCLKSAFRQAKRETQVVRSLTTYHKGPAFMKPGAPIPVKAEGPHG